VVEVIAARWAGRPPRQVKLQLFVRPGSRPGGPGGSGNLKTVVGGAS
jgi:hypothetical protein